MAVFRPVRMTKLTRKPNGAYFARKSIPADVRAAYAVAFEPRTESFFLRPASTPREVAEAEFHDWKAEINSRIARLRAAVRGEGEPALPSRQAHVLAGEWYSWFVGQHELDPLAPEQWEQYLEELEAIGLKFSDRNENTEAFAEDGPRGPREVKAVHDFLTVRAAVPTFLYAQRRSLGETAMRVFLDAVEGEFIAAMNTLRRRAQGDWSRDPRPDAFPTREPQGATPKTKLSGLTAWTAFELWVDGKRPAPSSVNRWRAVFLGLKEKFAERDIATITEDEAQQWIDGLAHAERSPHVVHDVWLRASKAIFTWAVDKKRLAANPFTAVSFPLPKRAGKTRLPDFTETEWRTILRATLDPPPPRMEPHNAAARRWVPWLCAYTGCRPGEACQLRAEDIRQHPKGFWFMRITAEAGTVKDGDSREVPLHEDLVGQGFVTFAQGKRTGPLFYDPKAQRKANDDPTNPKRPQYVKARQKLAEWTRSIGVDDPAISPTHAWRHTFIGRARRAGIAREIRFAICGHEMTAVGDGYSPPPVEELAPELRKFPKYEIGELPDEKLGSPI